jgi:hypothetical protein
MRNLSLVSDITKRSSNKSSILPVNFIQFGDDYLRKVLFYTLRLPGIYLLITLGILFDFILHLPLLIICSLENIFRGRIRKI